MILKRRAKLKKTIRSINFYFRHRQSNKNEMPESLTTAAEAALLARLKQDDHAALQAIFHQYFRYLCVTAFHFLSDTEKAKDMAQDVFLEIWRRRGELDIQSSLKSYLRRAVVNKSLNFLKTQRLDFSEPETNVALAAADHSPQLHLEAATAEAAYEKALAKLPPACRTIFILSRIDQLSHREISERLDISPKTIENQMTKALRILRSEMAAFL